MPRKGYWIGGAMIFVGVCGGFIWLGMLLYRQDGQPPFSFGYVYAFTLAGMALASLTFVARFIAAVATRHGVWPERRAAPVESPLVVRGLERVLDVSSLADEARLHRPILEELSWYRFTQSAYAYSVDEVRERDDRQPILLLRSFVADAGRRRTTIESAIVDGLWRWGPVIATAKPVKGLGSLGEAREEYTDGRRQLVWKGKRGAEYYVAPVAPPLGAARARIPSEGWRESVLSWLGEARLIVAIMGGTEGLAWEIEQIRQLQLVERLILVFPPGHRGALPGVELGSDVLARLDASSTRVMIFPGRDLATAISSRRQTPVDYQTAVEAAAELMLGRVGTAPPTRYRESSGFKRFLGG